MRSKNFSQSVDDSELGLRLIEPSHRIIYMLKEYDDDELQAALRASLDEGGTPDYSHSVPGTKRQEWICVDGRCLQCDCKELTTLEKRWIRSAVGSQLRTGFFALLPCTSGATSFVRSG